MIGLGPSVESSADKAVERWLFPQFWAVGPSLSAECPCENIWKDRLPRLKSCFPSCQLACLYLSWLAYPISLYTYRIWNPMTTVYYYPIKYLMRTTDNGNISAFLCVLITVMAFSNSIANTTVLIWNEPKTNSKLAINIFLKMYILFTKIDPLPPTWILFLFIPIYIHMYHKCIFRVCDAY